MAKIGFPKGSGKRLKVREKSVKSQGILKWILSGNPVKIFSETMKPTASIFSMLQCKVVHYVNPANHAPGVQIGRHYTLGAICSHGLIKNYQKIIFLQKP